MDKKLSKLGLLLQQRGICQRDFIALIKEKTGIIYGKSHVSLHVNAKKSFMTTDTAKIFAMALDVPMEDIC